MKNNIKKEKGSFYEFKCYQSTINYFYYCFNGACCYCLFSL